MSQPTAPLPFLQTPLGAVLREAALSALITLGLGLFIIGFETFQDSNNQLILRTRPSLLAWCVGLVFVGRLAQGLWRLRPRTDVTQGQGGASWLPRVLDFLGPMLFCAALFGPIAIILTSGTLQEARYEIDLGILILTYVMLGWGLNIVVGLAGLLDLGYVAFYAVGAYTYALLATHFGFTFWMCLPLAGIMAAFWGILLGFPVLRLRGDYLAIVTLAFGEIIRLVLINWAELTGGPAGIATIPRMTFFGIDFNEEPNGFAALFGLTFDPMHRMIFLYYVIFALAMLTHFVTVRLRCLPLGRAWEALREDDIACRALGLNTTLIKLSAFAIGAAFGGFAGSFFAARQGFISPESFNFMESAIILAIVVLGGMGSQIGVALAAILMIGGIEMLRHLTFLKAVFGPDFDPTQYRLILYGLGMVLIMIWRPRGLISNREPTAYLKDKSGVASTYSKEGHG